MINEFSRDLFDRQPDDDDFLCVRLGTGNIVAAREINYKKQERLSNISLLQLLLLLITLNLMKKAFYLLLKV